MPFYIGQSFFDKVNFNPTTRFIPYLPPPQKAILLDPTKVLGRHNLVQKFDSSALKQPEPLRKAHLGAPSQTRCLEPLFLGASLSTSSAGVWHGSLSWELQPLMCYDS